MSLNVALVGNPNVGKTSLYNRVTGSFEHVGNWHGVTVGSVTKSIVYESETVTMTDLPGLYSMSVYSFEESVTRDNVMSAENDLIVNVCEVNNLARNLYLTLQLLELGVPIVLAVNMMDELKKQKKVFNSSRIEKELQVRVVPMSAKYRSDSMHLMDAVMKSAKDKPKRIELPYLKKLPLDKVRNIISENLGLCGLDGKWACLKVLEKDKYVCEKLHLNEKQMNKIDALGDWQSKIAQYRYEYIDWLTEGAIVSEKGGKQKIYGFNAVDKIALNKYSALLIFFLVMGTIFYLTFGLIGKLLSDGLQWIIDTCIAAPIGSLMEGSGAPEWISALICDGIIGGVGGIIVFLPQIVLLFFFLALLEDSGYISRVAFMTDGLFKKIGLSGRSVFTMLMGFGCSATAVLTARGLEDKNTRIKTTLLTPFMSCSARLPVYGAIAGAFFLGARPLIIFALYVLGVAIAVAVAAFFERSVKSLKSGRSSFIMEMPPYRMPTFERVFQIILSNVKVFLIRIGTVIFAFNVIVWVLSYFSFTKGFVPDGSGSILQTVAGFISPVFAPLGFGNWKAVTALLSGVVAKEIVITSLQSLGGVEAIFIGKYAASAAVAFLSFTLLYTPCIATLGAIKKEIGKKYVLISLSMQTIVAYVVSLVVYWTGVAITEFKQTAWIFISAAIGIFLLIAVIMSLKQIFARKRCKGCRLSSCGKKGVK